MAKFLESDTYKAYEEELRTKQGVRILAKAPTQPRVLFIKKPVATPPTSQDVKMRVPEIKTYLLLWQTLGTKPARVAWAEVFLGLKTGVIDAAEGPISSAFAAEVPPGRADVIAHRPRHRLAPDHDEREGVPGAAAGPAEDPRRRGAGGDGLGAQAVREGDRRGLQEDGGRGRQGDRGRQGEPSPTRPSPAVETMEKDGAWSPGLYAKIQAIK